MAWRWYCFGWQSHTMRKYSVGMQVGVLFNHVCLLLITCSSQSCNDIYVLTIAGYDL